ncbi:hypothetical protein S40285_04203 [Stachybotrys chlorohalonatus IBT 40285]|uniref:DNA (cytosine-5-)-methyltransferase n=1 Tax=Stachybotrys chlorohalonatus (strain IBT 40285) TaxID=1283841 RepID=A0A084QJ99_STAC4|nr:hypothetical protein S40285_04203 [Stachybotrys chlorohalonata IBT 40285]
MVPVRSMAHLGPDALRSTAEHEAVFRRRHRERRSSTSSSCTLGGVDSQESDDFFKDEVIDLTIDNPTSLQDGLPHNTVLPLATVSTAAGKIKPGDCIEIQNTTLGKYDVNFLLVKSIGRDTDQQTKISGIPLTRTRRLFGKLPKKLNEVCMILHLNRGDNQTSQPLLVGVEPFKVLRKRSLVLTNTIYPENRPKTSPFQGETVLSSEDMENFGELVCRWKLSVYFKMVGRRTRPEEEALERVQGEQVSDDQYRVADEVLCNRWRGGREPGGSWSLDTAQTSIDLENGSSKTSRVSSTSLRKYTLFDSFSGAGGVSRGAKMAGFRVAFAVDKAQAVWDTYQTNFPETKLYKMSIDQFVRTTPNAPIRVDILHLSPPCQCFSPAHTVLSAHDDANIFALFGCNELIKKTRPRIITLEETFGITHERHMVYFRALIGDLTQFGYSVRWKTVRLCTWGSAQDRKRLILIAAAPGEKLPPFPRDTHAETADGGLKTFTTIRQAICGIRHGDNQHDLDKIRYYNPRRPQYNPNQLAMTVTTSGGNMYYPDGTREFTLREFASLQGFPIYHQFEGNKTATKRQIGNAFPPSTVKVLYEHLKTWLLQQDGMEPWGPSQNDIILIDDSTDMDAESSSSGRLASSVLVNGRVAMVVDPASQAVSDVEDVLMMDVIDLT